MGALLLDSINQPADLKQLNEKQVEQLCEEIRSFLVHKEWQGEVYKLLGDIRKKQGLSLIHISGPRDISGSRMPSSA